MKKLTFCLALAALLVAGCSHEKKEFTTRQLEGQMCLYYQDAPDDPWPIYEKNSYSLAWPADGLLSDHALRELMMLCFSDSSSSDVDAVAQRWLIRIWFTDDETLTPQVLDTISDTIEYSYVHLESSCTQDSLLAVFTVKTESYGTGAAHGLYSCNSLTVDKQTGAVVHLADLVADTNMLCEAVARAIQDLEVNKDVRECLFDEYVNVERMPMPTDYFIDSARNTIVVSYGLYHITPYACGIPSVVMPIYWLSKHVQLTPYAKRLFGPDSYLPE